MTVKDSLAQVAMKFATVITQQPLPPRETGAPDKTIAGGAGRHICHKIGGEWRVEWGC